MKSAFFLWLSAMRPKTLPLACSSIFLSSAIANYHGFFNSTIFALALLTAVLLQIISNLANDYGDAVSGADNSQRVGPKRVMQSGQVSKYNMQQAIVIACIAATVSGLSLLTVAFSTNTYLLIIFILLGAVAIIGAITYTMGTSPYGYKGLGDIAVFMFFGWLAVVGGYYLYTQQFLMTLLLPASACGLFSASVLNINNMRDLNSDKAVGKNTLAVYMGHQKAHIYHGCLLASAFLCLAMYIVIEQLPVLTWLYLLTLPMFLRIFEQAKHYQQATLMNQLLKFSVLTTLLASVLFSIGLL